VFFERFPLIEAHIDRAQLFPAPSPRRRHVEQPASAQGHTLELSGSRSRPGIGPWAKPERPLSWWCPLLTSRSRASRFSPKNAWLCPSRVAPLGLLFSSGHAGLPETCLALPLSVHFWRGAEPGIFSKKMPGFTPLEFILKWTCWFCGTTPSALEQKRARVQQIGEPNYTEKALEGIQRAMQDMRQKPSP